MLRVCSLGNVVELNNHHRGIEMAERRFHLLNALKLEGTFQINEPKKFKKRLFKIVNLVLNPQTKDTLENIVSFAFCQIQRDIYGNAAFF